MDEVEVEDISDKLASVGVAGPKAAETLTEAGIDVCATRARAGDRCGVAGRRHFGRAQHASADGWLRDLVGPRECRETLGCLGERRSDAGRQRCAGDVSHRARGAALRSRSARTRPAAGNRPAACAEFQQRLLHRAGDRGANSRARQRASHASSDSKCKASRRSRERRFAPTTKTWARSPARRGCHSSGERTLALGYLRREVAAPGTAVQIGEQSATVKSLPFEF